MKPENKAVRIAIKKSKEPALKPWQKKPGLVLRKTKRANEYASFNDDIFIGFTYITGGSR
jgi:hypothetical protein